MIRFAPAAILAVLLLLPPPSRADDVLPAARKQLARGDYADAISALEKAAKASDAGADVLEALARAYIEVGRYEEVTPLAALLTRKGKSGQSAAAVVLGHVELLTGRYEDAIARLRKEVRARPTSWEARIRLSEALVAIGTPSDKLDEADAIADYWQQGKVVGAPALTWLGRALHLTKYPHNANDIFLEVTSADPDYLLAQLYWAELFLSTEDEANADKSLAEVLARNPSHPEALALTAYIDISSDNDAAKATATVKKALAVNPRSVLALQVSAHVLIETEQYPEALATLAEALVTNPRSPKSLAMVAACHLLLEDEAQFRTHMKKALAVNRRFAEGYHLVAEYVSKQHRYREALDLEKEAIALDKEYWPAHVGLGVGFSRLGDDAKANDLLQEAFENDRFNVRAYNMTANFYDGPAKRMSWHPMGPFRVRLTKQDASVLTRVLPAFLRDAYATHEKKYGFAPKKPLHLELFEDRDTFSVRTVGYPRMGAHGVCFGHVVTTLSPRAGDFNWGMVIWHELAHIWHIQMSDSRVPRWFTEGLAEHETTLRRPEWRREMNDRLWEAFRAGQLKGIGRFNTMFTQAKDMSGMVLAYYYAAQVVAFIDKEWGFGVFPKMLRAWARRKPTADVFREVLGVELETFDARMKQHIEKELAAFANEYAPEVGTDETAKSYLAGKVAVRQAKWPEAAKALDAVLDAGKDGVRLRLLRASAAIGAKEWKVAREHIEKALSLDPHQAEAYVMLREVLEALGDQDGKYALLRRAADNDEHGLDLVLEVAELALGRSDLPVLTDFVERGMYIAPFDVHVRVMRGRALILAGKAKEALAEAEEALSLPAGKAQYLARLLQVRALAELGRKKEARDQLEKVLGDPELADRPDVLEVKKLLDGGTDA